MPYDPAAAALRFKAQPVAVGMRQVKLVGPLLAFLGRVVMDMQLGKEEAHRKASCQQVGRSGAASGRGGCGSYAGGSVPAAWAQLSVTVVGKAAPPGLGSAPHAPPLRRFVWQKRAAELTELISGLGPAVIKAAVGPPARPPWVWQRGRWDS